MALFKRVSTLMTGAAGGQLILLLFTPVLARIYTPQDFGFFATSVGFAMVFSGVACFRYDAAILINDKKIAPATLLHLSLLLILSSGIFFFAILLATKSTHVYQSIIPHDLGLFEMVSLFFMFSLSGLLTTWHARFNRFNVISVSKIVLASSMVGCQWFGYMEFGGTGLVLGNIGGLLAANIFLLYYMVIKDSGSVFIMPSIKDIKASLVTHVNFPKYSVFSTLLNGVSNQLPNMLFSGFFGSSYAGYYSMSTRFTRGPVGLIGQSIYQVVAAHIGNNATDMAEIRKTIIAILSKMSLYSGPVFIIGLFVVEPVFDFLLGEGWAEAGSMAKVLLPWVYLLYLSWPMTGVFNTLGQQRYVLAFNVLFVLAIVLPFLFLEYTSREGVVLLMMLFGSVARFGYIYSALKLVKANIRECLTPSIAYWVISVLIVYFIY